MFSAARVWPTQRWCFWISACLLPFLLIVAGAATDLKVTFRCEHCTHQFIFWAIPEAQRSSLQLPLGGFAIAVVAWALPLKAVKGSKRCERIVIVKPILQAARR